MAPPARLRAAGSRTGRAAVLAPPNSSVTSDRLARLSTSDTRSRPNGGESMAEAAKTEFWRDLKPIEKVFQTTRCRRCTRRTSRPTTSATTSRSARPSAPGRVWISISQNSWCDVLMATGAGPRQPPLPPARGLRLHDLGQVGLPRARLGRDRRRLRLRDAGRGAHARRLRVRRADEGALQGQGPADLARREGRRRRTTSTSTTTSTSARSTTRRSASGADYIDGAAALSSRDRGGPWIRRGRGHHSSTPADLPRCD